MNKIDARNLTKQYLYETRFTRKHIIHAVNGTQKRKNIKKNLVINEQNGCKNTKKAICVLNRVQDEAYNI